MVYVRAATLSDAEHCSLYESQQPSHLSQMIQSTRGRLVAAALSCCTVGSIYRPDDHETVLACVKCILKSTLVGALLQVSFVLFILLGKHL